MTRISDLVRAANNAQPAPLDSLNPGIFNRTVNAVGDTASTAAHILGIPGGIVRGGLNAFVNPDEWSRIFTGIWDPSERVTGSELVGKSKDEFTWSGLGVEIFTDPLTYLTFGAKTAVGQSLKAVGREASRKAVQESLAAAGSKRAIKALPQTAGRVKSLQDELSRLGVKETETYGKTLKEQFAKGHRAAVTLDVPFTNLRQTLVKATYKGAVLGDLADTARAAVTQRDTAKSLREAFVASEVRPDFEILRQELRREVKYEQSKHRRSILKLQQKRAKLGDTDDFTDILEHLDPLLDDSYDNLLEVRKRVTQDNNHLNKLIKTKLEVNDFYRIVDNADPETWAFAQQVRQLNKELLVYEQSAGVAVDELSRMGYAARILTPQGRRLLAKDKEGRQLIKRFLADEDLGTSSSFQRRRQNRSSSIKELNERLRERYKQPSNFLFFDEDVVRLTANRFMDSARQVGRARFTQTLVDLYGEKAAKDLIEEGKQIGLEKLLAPRNALVTNVRLAVDFTKENIAEYIATKPGIKGIRAGTTSDSIVIGGRQARLSDGEAARVAYEYRYKSKFLQLDKEYNTKAYSLLEDRWGSMIKEGMLTKGERALLRMLTAQLDGNKLRELTDVTFDYRKNSMGTYFHDTKHINLNPTYLSESKLTEFYGPVTAKKQLSQANNRSPRVLMHEIGHLMHHHLEPKEWSYVKKLHEEAQYRRGFDKGFRTLRERIESTGSNRPVKDEFYRVRTPNEFFAESFAQFMLGQRTTDDALNSMLKDLSDTYKDYRDKVLDSGRFLIDLPKDEFEELDFALRGAFSNATGDASTLLRGVAPGTRKQFILDLQDDPWTRRDYLDIKPDASESSIRKMLATQGVEQTALPKEAMEFATRFLGRTRYSLDSSTWWGKFVSNMDQIHGIYRTSLTQYFPAFHARNYLSNVFLNTMAGVGIKHYHEAYRMLKNMSEEDAVYLASMEVIDSGKTREVIEYMRSVEGGITRGLKDNLSRIPGAAQTGRMAHDVSRTVGYAVENHTRLAHYLAMKAKGMSDGEAADSVVKYLFDYTDLTDFEKAFPRRMMLFYTFFRKNLPLMLEKTFTDPRFMITYFRSVGLHNPNIQQPDWLPDSFFFGEDEKGNLNRVNFGLPPEDLARFDPKGGGIARMFELLISNTAPTIRVPWEFVNQRSTFFGTPTEGTTMERVASVLPTSRVTGQLSRFAESFRQSDDANMRTTPVGELSRFLTGAAVRKIDPQIQKDLDMLDRIQDRLKEKVRQGTGRTIEIVGQRRGQDDEELRQLNSMASQIRARLREVRE